MRFAGLDLARRLESAEAANDAECTAAQPGTAVEPLAGGWAIFAGAASPLTRAIGIGLTGRVDGAGLDELERFFHSRGARAAIDFCPLADPCLLDELRRRGYRPAEFNNALVRELAGSGPWPADPRIRRALPNEAELWARTVGCGFFETDDLAEEEMEVGRAILRMGRAECWLAMTEEGEPVGGAALSARDGLGLLFADSTLLRHRRRGLHAALIAARLDSAAGRGCDLASACTQPGGASQRNYERLGFRVAYTKVLLVEEEKQ